MGQSAEIQGIIAALAPVLRSEARLVGGERAAVFVSLVASRAATRAGAPLVAARYWRAERPDVGADRRGEWPGEWIDITPEPRATPDAGPDAAVTGQSRLAARLAEAARPAVDRLAAMVLGTGLSSFSLTVRLAGDAASGARPEVVRAAVEGFDVVEATATWSWQNRFRDPEPAALAIALVMTGLAAADEGIDRDAMVPHDVRSGEALRDAARSGHRADDPHAATEKGIERALRPCLALDGVDADHVRRRHAAWLRGMRRATGRPEFDESASERSVVSLRTAGEPFVRDDGGHPQPSRRRPLAAAE
jgi:hypothetical protein